MDYYEKEKVMADEELMLYKEIVEQNITPIFLFYAETKLIFKVNKSFANLLGYSAEELLNLTIYDIVPVDKSSIDANIQKLLDEKSIFVGERKYCCKDGRLIDVEVYANLIIYAGKNAISVTLCDITLRKKMEDEVLKAIKLESVGVLAGGIAHDFNNILTAIIGNLSLAKMKVAPESDVYARLIEAEKASIRAQNLALRLLTFSKGGKPLKETVLLQQLIKESANFVLSGSNVKCEFEIASNLSKVEADEGQISQVINNLVINADHAMPFGGVIRISAVNKIVTEEDLLPLKKGKYVRISVNDHGTGIPEEHLNRVFDPYFTTKLKGSGLGLSIVYSIIKNHNGYITVESEIGIGTTFIIYLPSLEREVQIKEEKKDNGIKGNGRILIMDDEEIIRDVAKEMLTYFGYDVETSADGGEAVRMYKKAKEEGNPFDVVIMDLTIPGGMGGKDAMEKILMVDPLAKGIVSSGYSNDPVIADYNKYGFSAVIPKPYKMEELGKIIKKVLEGE